MQGAALAAVWHAAAPDAAGGQILDCAVCDLAVRAKVAGGRMPLSAGAGLAWLGFGEDGELLAYDTQARAGARTSPGVRSWQESTSGPVPRAGRAAHADGRHGRRVGADVQLRRPRQARRGLLAGGRAGRRAGVHHLQRCCAAPQGAPGRVHAPPRAAGVVTGRPPQVIPRPALSRLPLRVPVLPGGADAEADLEAVMLRTTALASHLRGPAARTRIGCTSRPFASQARRDPCPCCGLRRRAPWVSGGTARRAWRKSRRQPTAPCCACTRPRSRPSGWGARWTWRPAWRCLGAWRARCASRATTGGATLLGSWRPSAALAAARLRAPVRVQGTVPGRAPADLAAAAAGGRGG